MLIDSMVIKLIRGGAGISPEYMLTVYGDGRVVYEGIENVQVKGIIESTIDEDAVLSLLNEFKESGFFSVSDIFSVEESTDRPYTTISISIPKENGETTSKSVKYYHGDRHVPKELKNLEDKIDEIVGTVKWVGVSTEGFETKKEPVSTTKPHIEEKTTLEPMKKKPIKLIYVGIFIIILVSIVVYGLYSGIISLTEEEDEAEPPNITVLESTSYVDPETGAYTPADSFSIGDNITIYLKYTDISITKNETCDLYFELVVENNGTEYHKPAAISRTYIGQCIQVWWFETNDLWPSGDYNATATLTDSLTDLSTSKSTTFTII